MKDATPEKDALFSSILAVDRIPLRRQIGDFGHFQGKDFLGLCQVRADIALMKPHIIRRPHDHSVVSRIELGQFNE